MASVSASGVVTGLSTGNATIEAEASGKVGQVSLAVEPDPCTTPLSLAVGQVRMLSGPQAVACIKLAPTSGPSDYLFITANADQAQDNTAVYSVLLTQVSAASIAAAQSLVFDPRAYLEMQAIEQVDRAEERIRVQGQQLFRSVRPAVRETIRREANVAYSVSPAIAVEGDTVTIRVPDINSANLCTTGYKEIRAAVKKTTAHATIVQDVAAPYDGIQRAGFHGNRR